MSEIVTPVEPLSRQEIRTLEARGRRAVEKKYNTLEQLKVEYVPIDSIFPNPYNPNRQTERDFDLLKKSIAEDGFTQPVVVQRSSKQIVDGEHRWRALNQMGFKEIAVVFVDMTPQQMRVSTLRHNRARGSEDVELAMKMLRDLRELGALDHAVDSLNISDNELQALLDDLPAAEMMAADEFSPAWVPSEVGNQEGDRRSEMVASDRRISISKQAEAAMDQFEAQMEELEANHDHEGMRDANIRFKKVILMVSATFSNEESQLVRSVLNPKPAEQLLELCLKVVMAHKDEYRVECLAAAAEIMQKKGITHV